MVQGSLSSSLLKVFRTVTCRLELGCENAKEERGQVEKDEGGGKETRLYTTEAGPCLPGWCPGPGGGGSVSPTRDLAGWDEKPFPLLREQVGLSRLAHRVVPFHKLANFDWAPPRKDKRRSRPHTHTRGLPCGTSGHVLARVWPRKRRFSLPSGRPAHRHPTQRTWHHYTACRLSICLCSGDH